MCILTRSVMGDKANSHGFRGLGTTTPKNSAEIEYAFPMEDNSTTLTFFSKGMI